MANYTTTSDLQNAALKAAGELTDGTSPFASDALEYINAAYQSIVSGGNEFNVELGEPWSWAKSSNPGILTLEPVYETGTVTLTNGSTSGTFSSGPADSKVGWFLKISGRPEFFKIATHTAAATAFTIDGAYTDTSGSGLSFSLYKLEYALTTGIQRLIAPFTCYRGQAWEANNEGKIYGTDLFSLTSKFPLHLLELGVPTFFAEVKRDSSGVITVRFNKVPASQTRVEYEYIPIPTDLTASPDLTPILPREVRIALVYCATYYLMLDKNDEGAQDYAALARAKLEAMVQANRKQTLHISVNRGRIIPRLDRYKRRFILQEPTD